MTIVVTMATGIKVAKAHKIVSVSRKADIVSFNLIIEYAKQK